MIHVLYDSGVHDGEAVTARSVRELSVYRVKLATGRYVHVLAGSEAEVNEWAGVQELAMAATPDRMTLLETELRELRRAQDAIGRVTAGKPKDSK